MIELAKRFQGEDFASEMTFDFTEVHPAAKFNVSFQRTLRIPDDDKEYPLPPGLGSFPIVHTEDYKDRVPAKWLERQGVMIPMYQSEALWMSFSGNYDPERGVNYPFALKIAAGKRSALTGKAWVQALKEKDYVIIPDQPWLDGFVVEEGVIRQFVAMPLGMGLTVEAQLSGKEEFGGVQFEAFPMKLEEYEKRFPKRPPRREGIIRSMGLTTEYGVPGVYCNTIMEISENSAPIAVAGAAAPAADMGMGAGGKMRQQVFEDKYGLDVWDRDTKRRVYVHLANSLAWRAITKMEPPNTPFTPADYKRYNFPWFDYYRDDRKALAATMKMAGVKSILQLGYQKGLSGVIPDNTSVEVPKNQVKDLSPIKKKGEVRDGRW
jgi:hypothetical protein